MSINNLEDKWTIQRRCLLFVVLIPSICLGKFFGGRIKSSSRNVAFIFNNPSYFETKRPNSISSIVVPSYTQPTILPYDIKQPFVDRYGLLTNKQQRFVAANELSSEETAEISDNYDEDEVEEGDDGMVATYRSQLLEDEDDEEEQDVHGDEFRDNRQWRFSGLGRLYVSKVNSSKEKYDKLEKNKGLAVPNVLERLQQAVVAVVGIGGVGSWTAEALCRSGIGTIILIDCDDICISNTNRQIHTTVDSIGQYKVDIMKERLKSINPTCKVRTIHEFLDSDNVNAIFKAMTTTLPQLTAVIDAIDDSAEKAALLSCASQQYKIPIIVSVGGGAGLHDPTQVEWTDMTNVRGDKLLRTARKIMRSDYGFPPGQKFHDRVREDKTAPWDIDCVYSTELPTKLPKNTEAVTSTFRVCDGQFGTACFVTGTLGFVAAGRVIDRIALCDYDDR